MLEKNVFYREIECQSLLSFIEKSKKGLNICIDGAWGVGKSRFCREVENKLENRSFKTIYFDAFKHDLQEDPLLALLGEVSQLQKNDEKKEVFIKNVSRYCAPIVKSSLKALLKRASFDFVDIDSVNEVADSIKEGAGSSLSLYIEDSIREYNKKDESIASIKKIIKKFMEEESCGLVIIIDELDRCRPTYALEVIEKIKHVFDIDGVTFILSMCKEQLLASIENIYGKSSQSESYLEKFIDFTLVLRNGVNKDESIVESYCKGLLKDRLEYIDIEDDEREEVIFCLSDICLRQSLTLREVEKVVDSCIRVFLTFDKNEMPFRIRSWYCAICVICGYLSWADNELSHASVKSSHLSDKAVNHLNIPNFYKSSNKDRSMFEIRKDKIDNDSYNNFYSLIAYLNQNKKSKLFEIKEIKHGHDKLKEYCEVSSENLNMIFSMCMARATGAGSK